MAQGNELIFPPHPSIRATGEGIESVGSLAQADLRKDFARAKH